MPINLFTSDLSNKAFRSLLGSKSVFDVATKVEEIHPPCTRPHRAALFDPQDIAKVTGVGMGTTLDMELLRIHEGVSNHKGTYLAELRDVILLDGALYKFRFKLGISYRNALASHTGRVESIEDGGVLAQSWLGSRYFGHWIKDDMPLGILAQEVGRATGVERKCTPQQAVYADIFNVKHELLPELAHLSKISVLTDSHYNDGKVARWKTLRERIAKRSSGKKYSGVMLLRGASGDARLLLNEAAIASRLEKLGFLVVDPAKVDIEEFLSQATGADIVVGVEGSQLANGFFCLKEGGSMLVLQPPFRFNNIYKDACDAVGAKYGFVVGDVAEKGFTINADAVERLVEKLCK